MESLPDNAAGNSITGCGLSTLHLSQAGCANPLDCERTYYVYIPESLCDEGDIDSFNTDLSDNLGLPLVFAIYGWKGHYKLFLPWTEFADLYQYVLVIPEGVQNSFNGDVCCGYALENNIDDVTFLRKIITNLGEELPFVDKHLTYGVGHSNGGYLVTHAAILFRAVAPISGYEYDVDKISYMVPGSVGLFLHHSEDDNVVSFSGCCTDPTMPECCCGISNYNDQCTSVYDAFDQWANKINHCRSDGQLSSGLDDSTPTISTLTTASFTYSDDNLDVVCHTAEGCQANTTVCVYKNIMHFTPFRKTFPYVMRDEISKFFAMDACSRKRGQFYKDEVDGVWKCSSKRRFLLAVGNDGDSDAMSITDLKLSALRGSERRNVPIPLVFAVLSLVLVNIIVLRRKYVNRKGGVATPFDDRTLT